MKKATVAITVVGVISSLMTIWQGVQEFIKNKAITITPVMTGCMCLVAMCIVVAVVISSRRGRYIVYKGFSHVTRRPDLKYHVKEKNIFYTYKDLHNLEYRVTTNILAKSDGFSSFTGKFRWSKPQPLKLFHVHCQSKHHSLILGRDGTWNTYTVEFDAAPKGKERTVDILIDGLSDPENEALPFCSSSIVEHTGKLKMTVKLEGGLKFDLDQIRFLVYDNGASVAPIIEEEYNSKKRHNLIIYDPIEEQITVEETWPVYGYRYQLKWEFK